VALLKIGQTAPALDLVATDGTNHSLDDYPQQPVAVLFSCCHCPYVIAWEDRIDDIARDYKGRAGLLVINSNDHIGDTIEDMRERVAQKAFAFPFLRDDTQEVARAYGATRTPEAFLLDSSRRLIYHGAPDSSYQDPGGAVPHLRQALEATLSSQQPAAAETPPVGCTIKWRSG